MHYEKELSTAVKAVQQAGRLCVAVQSRLLADHSVSKEDRSPVTIADFGAQAVVNYTLHQDVPDDPVMGEEDGDLLRSTEGSELAEKVFEQVHGIFPTLGKEDILCEIDRGSHPGGPKGRFWVLDPIDGTKGFLRLDQYAVALALIEDGDIKVGALACPNFPADLDQPDGAKGCILAAVKGGGTSLLDIDTLEAVPAAASSCSNPADARFCESVEKAHSSHDTNAEIARLLGITRDPYRMDSQCKYAAVARGLAEIYLRLPVKKDYQEKIWDHAAGCIVLTEAGGNVTDIRGRALDFTRGHTLSDNFGIIASNGAFHDQIVDAVGKAFSG